MKRWLSVVAATLLLCATSAFAGTVSINTKLGILDWVETDKNRQFVRETGPVQEVELTHTSEWGRVELESSVGLWLAELYYNGEDLKTLTPVKNISADIGLKGDLTALVKAYEGQRVSVGPMLGVETNLFTRIRPGESWVTATLKPGVRVVLDRKFELRAGARVPVYTRDFVHWDPSVGPKGIFSVSPKGMVTPFVNISWKPKEGVEFGIYFEEWKWKQSDPAAYDYTGTASAAARKGYAYQPDTTAINSGIEFKYRF